MNEPATRRYVERTIDGETWRFAVPTVRELLREAARRYVARLVRKDDV